MKLFRYVYIRQQKNTRLALSHIISMQIYRRLAVIS